MGIKQQVDDAVFLAKHGRHKGALTNLMLALAMSSRKVFPENTTKSIKEPCKLMNDEEAFILFAGDRIRKIVFGGATKTGNGTSGISVNYKQQQLDVAYIFYKFYRRELVGDVELPEDIEFCSLDDNSHFSASISHDNTMMLDYCWIDLLVNALVNAKCNRTIFEIRRCNLVPQDGISDVARAYSVFLAHNISPRRYQILKEIVRQITPARVVQESDDFLKEKFKTLTSHCIVSCSELTGLCTDELADHQGNLLPKGIEIIREIGAAYKLVEV